MAVLKLARPTATRHVRKREYPMPASATKTFQAADQFTGANMLAEGFDVHLQKPGHLLHTQYRMGGESHDETLA
jgi:hypothetical protein